MMLFVGLACLLGSRMMLAQAAGSPERPAAPSDFDFLEGRWNIVYNNAQPGVPPDIHGVWTAEKRADGRVLEDEFRLFGPDHTTVALGITYRVFDSVRIRWDMRYVGVISPRPDGTALPVAQWAVISAWRDGDTIRADQHGERSDLRITYYDISRNHFSWKADVSTDGGATWHKDQIKIEATRAP